MVKRKKYRVSSKRKHLYKLTYSIYDFYDSLPIKEKISKELYISIMKEFFSLLTTKVIVDRKRIKLPYNLDIHRIKKGRLKNQIRPRIDFNKTKQLKQTIYHLNNHSFGFYYRWYWEKSHIPLKNKNFYKFELTKKNNLLLAKEIFRCNKDPFIKDYDALF
jgi:hypothetical protein